MSLTDSQRAVLAQVISKRAPRLPPVLLYGDKIQKVRIPVKRVKPIPSSQGPADIRPIPNAKKLGQRSPMTKV